MLPVFEQFGYKMKLLPELQDQPLADRIHPNHFRMEVNILPWYRFRLRNKLSLNQNTKR